jgi:feruloyl esterase
MEAIIRWVEQGQAPEMLMAERRDSNKKIISTRPLFPYPQVAKYKGRGSIDDAAHFEAKTPAR